MKRPKELSLEVMIFRDCIGEDGLVHESLKPIASLWVDEVENILGALRAHYPTKQWQATGVEGVYQSNANSEGYCLVSSIGNG